MKLRKFPLLFCLVSLLYACSPAQAPTPSPTPFPLISTPNLISPSVAVETQSPGAIEDSSETENSIPNEIIKEYSFLSIPKIIKHLLNQKFSFIVNKIETYKQHITIQNIYYLGLLIFALYTAIRAKKHLKIIEDQERVNGINNIFEKFNAVSERDSRRWVYHNCENLMILIIEEDPEEPLKNLNLIENLCNSLDLTSSFILKDLIHKEDAIEIYGDSIIRCWVVLGNWIMKQREKRGQKRSLWMNIERLANEIIEHDNYSDWKKEGVKIYTLTDTITFEYKFYK
ncbi:MAG: hypothetical protein HOL47_07660 [Chloroflexi bacterium]|nr:hypothetical protein [Chloroflexota bacterium]